MGLKRPKRRAGFLSLLIKLVGFVIIVDLLVIMTITAIGWFYGWQNLDEFKNAVKIAGILQIGIGFLGIRGNWGINRSFDYQRSLSTDSEDSWERIQQYLVDFVQGYSFILVMFLSGGVSIIIGWLL